ncbi:hypothetical protein KSS87_012788 [Heliosperma pusillum]|nr:hypothetical protein KSS87_012788 [Heliosperma pusillum]
MNIKKTYNEEEGRRRDTNKETERQRESGKEEEGGENVIREKAANGFR